MESPYLAPIARTTITDQIVGRLVGLIVEGGLKAGDKLPSERELMTRLSVGRSSLREAIKVLSAVGVVEVSVGEGMFVGRGETSILTKPLTWGLLLGEHSTREVVEARRIVEVELAGLAAERATPEEIEAIRKHLEALHASQDDAEGYTTRDLEFHLAVGRAAHNSVLFQVLDTLRHIVRAWMEKVTIEYFEGKPHPSFNDHVVIYDAIRTHDVAGARQAMEVHLEAGGSRLLSVVSKAQSENKAKPGGA